MMRRKVVPMVTLDMLITELLGKLKKERACSEHNAARDYNRGFRDGLKVARNLAYDLARDGEVLTSVIELIER